MMENSKLGESLFFVEMRNPTCIFHDEIRIINIVD